MSLGVKPKVVFLSIKDGKITRKTARGSLERYDYVEGILINVECRERDFTGETVLYWYFDIQESRGEIYSLALSYNSGIAKSILNSLASVDKFGVIRIEAYSKDGFNKVMVYNNGQRLDWRYRELPPVEEVIVGDKTVKDESKRMELFNNIAKELGYKLSKVI
jgi:hypothetical protein